MNVKHNKRNTPEYMVWRAMKKRCRLESDQAFPNYGGRGITVCDEWFNSFEAFYKDLGPRPSANHSLDRIDNNKGYFKENCRWTTSDVQNANRRGIHWLSLNGATKRIHEWVPVTGLSLHVLYKRKNCGWSDKETLTIPLYGKRDV